VNQQQSAENVSIDDIPIDIATTQSEHVEPDDVPDEIGLITRGLASERPPTNPLVVVEGRSVVVYSRNGWNRSLRSSGLSSGRATSRPIRPATSIGSTTSSTTSSPSASLTRRHRFDKQSPFTPWGIQPDASEQKRFRQQAVQTERKPSELVAGDVPPPQVGHISVSAGRVVPQWRHSYRVDVLAVRMPTTLAKHVDKTHLLGDSVALVVNPRLR